FAGWEGGGRSPFLPCGEKALPGQARRFPAGAHGLPKQKGLAARPCVSDALPGAQGPFPRARPWHDKKGRFRRTVPLPSGIQTTALFAVFIPIDVDAAVERAGGLFPRLGALL